MRILSVVSSVLVMFVCAAQAQNRVVNAPVYPQKDTINITLHNSTKPERVSNKNDWDHLTIISDSRINDLLEINREENIRRGGFEGYRVQIYQGTNKEEADLIRSSFLAKFPEYKVYRLFQTPDFKVRVGDFRTRSEAIKMKYLIKEKFQNPLVGKDLPDPFIIDKTIINFPDLQNDKTINKGL